MTDRFIIPQTQPETNIEANEAQVSAPPRPDEKQEMEQVNALYSLLENRYADMVCLCCSFDESRMTDQDAESVVS